MPDDGDDVGPVTELYGDLDRARRVHRIIAGHQLEAAAADSAARVDVLDGEERSLVHPLPRRLVQRRGEAEADDVGFDGRTASDQGDRRSDQREGTEQRMATARAAAGRVGSLLHHR